MREREQELELKLAPFLERESGQACNLVELSTDIRLTEAEEDGGGIGEEVKIVAIFALSLQNSKMGEEVANFYTRSPFCVSDYRL